MADHHETYCQVETGHPGQTCKSYARSRYVTRVTQEHEYMLGRGIKPTADQLEDLRRAACLVIGEDPDTSAETKEESV